MKEYKEILGEWILFESTNTDFRWYWEYGGKAYGGYTETDGNEVSNSFTIERQKKQIEDTIKHYKHNESR
jgi:hypothetical protein